MTENTVAPEKSWNMPFSVFFQDARNVFKWDELGAEILKIAFPAALALAADPVASLIDTVFVGRLGPVEIAAVGVSIAIFNQISKVAIFPLVNITTSFVAEEDTIKRVENGSEKIINDIENDSINKIENEDIEFEDVKVRISDGSDKDTEKKKCDHEGCMIATRDPPIATKSTEKASQKKNERRQIPSASTALVVGSFLGLLQTMFIIFLANPILAFMGVKDDHCTGCTVVGSLLGLLQKMFTIILANPILAFVGVNDGSPMFVPARRYLTLRALGSPALAFSLAMQGVFRGFKDTKTPLFATVIGDTTNIILDPILIFACNMGVTGAAIAHVFSQYLISAILLCKLMKQVDLMPPQSKDLPFRKFLKSGSLILTRVLAATICVTLAVSRAARLGSTPSAAFQICLQVWLTSSLIADGLAVAGQAILACAFTEKDYDKATKAATRVLQMGFVLGLGLAAVVGLGLHFGDSIFSKDKSVLHILSFGIPFVAGTQPINSIAFVFDGINYGSFDFAYSSYSMVIVAVISIGCLFLLSNSYGFVGIWIALSIFMVLRASAGIFRMASGTGPWRHLKGKSLS